MKKALTVFLILAVLLPFAVLADESDVVGCWAHYELQTDGTPLMSMLYLAEDHTCYFIIQSFNHDGAGLGRAYVGAWSMNSDGSVYAKTGNNSQTDLRFVSENIAVEKSTMEVYVSITPFTLN